MTNTSKPSETPETDAEAFINSDINCVADLVTAEFARTLERELNAANAKITSLEDRYAQRGLMLEELEYAFDCHKNHVNAVNDRATNLESELAKANGLYHAALTSLDSANVELAAARDERDALVVEGYEDCNGSEILERIQYLEQQGDAARSMNERLQKYAHHEGECMPTRKCTCGLEALLK